MLNGTHQGSYISAHFACMLFSVPVSILFILPVQYSISIHLPYGTSTVKRYFRKFSLPTYERYGTFIHILCTTFLKYVSGIFFPR